MWTQNLDTTIRLLIAYNRIYPKIFSGGTK
jgi:hypothetical protein